MVHEAVFRTGSLENFVRVDGIEETREQLIAIDDKLCTIENLIHWVNASLQGLTMLRGAEVMAALMNNAKDVQRVEEIVNTANPYVIGNTVDTTIARLTVELEEVRCKALERLVKQEIKQEEVIIKLETLTDSEESSNLGEIKSQTKKAIRTLPNIYYSSPQPHIPSKSPDLNDMIKLSTWSQMPKDTMSYDGKTYKIRISGPPNTHWFTGRVRAFWILGQTKKDVAKNMMLQEHKMSLWTDCHPE